MDSIRSSEDINAKARVYDRTKYENFLEAIRKLPPPPCADCPLKRKCATKELACEQFWQYVHSGAGERPWPGDTPPTRIPNKAIYNALSEDTAGQRRQRIRQRMYAPSRPRGRPRKHPLPIKQVIG